jgi:hypothetical protein
MSLLRLIYVSRVARQVRFADAEQIACDAAESNRARQLTGLLVYSPTHFIQVLEGESADVLTLISRIRLDNRHVELRILDQREVVTREFGDWAMLARRLPGTKALDATALTTEGALQLLRSACAGE